MKVKLLTDEVSEAQYNAAMNTPACDTAWDDVKAEYAAIHDAAPDDATRALEHHLRTVRMVLNREASLNDLGGSYDALQAAPETAALIRQAEERGGST